MTKRLALMGLVCAMMCGGPFAYAHHGRDFLFSQTADLPHPGEIYLLPRQDFINEGDVEEFEFEPAVLFGVVDWLALEMHAHIAKEVGEPLEYESTAGALHFRMTPPESRLRLGLSGEYEYSNIDDADDRVEFRLAASSTFSRSIVAVNALAEEGLQDGEDPETGYSIGFRNAITDRAAWGLEVQDILDNPEYEILLGLYVDPTSRFTMNFGAGTGLGDNDLDLSLRSALVWRLGRLGR